MRVTIHSLSSAILDCLAHPGTLGTIHSIFDRAVNIRLADSARVIAITCLPAGGLPYAFRLAGDAPASFLSSGLKVGQKVDLTEESSLRINGARNWYDFSGAANWDPFMGKLNDPGDMHAFYELLDWAAAYIYHRSNQAGLVPLLEEPRRLFNGPVSLEDTPDRRMAALAAAHITGLLGALHRENESELSSKVTRLLGFGIGGTPSGDDLIVGLLAALNRSSHSHADRLLQQLTTALNSQLTEAVTSLLSLTVLRHALDGQFSEKIHDVTHLLMQPGDIDSLKTSLERLLLHGATSGSEMFLGVYLGFILLDDTGLF
jgi:hypothetical protein